MGNGNSKGRPRKRAKSWMGGRNARGLSTKRGEIVDGRRECEGAVHENGQNRGWEAEIQRGCPRKRAKSWMGDGEQIRRDVNSTV